MPNIAIQLTAGSLGPNPCFTDEQSRFNAYVAAIQSSLPINFTTVIVSTTAPAPDDRDKVWIKTDGAGRILGTYLFSNGLWQNIFGIQPNKPGEIREYDPAWYTPAQSAEECWFPMDGSVTGVQDRRGLFLVGAGTRVLTAAQIAAGVQASTFVSGVVGGSETTTLTALNIPAHTSHSLISEGIAFSGSAGGTNQIPNLVRGTATGGYITGGNTTGVDVNGNPNPPVPAQTLPPYAPTYWMQWRPDLV
jgi:hypothetical protein